MSACARLTDVDGVEVVVAHDERAPLPPWRGASLDEKVSSLDLECGWSLPSLTSIRWLAEHGFDPGAPGCEVGVLRAALT